VAASPSTSLTLKLRADAASSAIDSSSAWAVTGSMTLSSRKDPVCPKATVASLPTTRATTIVRLSTITGFTLPGMIELPGWSSGIRISPMPQRGPEASQRMLLATLNKVTAIARSWPLSTSAAALATVANITSIWPPIRSVMAGAAPLYGTAVRLTFAISLNSSPARCAEVPTPNVP